MLKAHQHKCGLEQSGVCECGQRNWWRAALHITMSKTSGSTQWPRESCYRRVDSEQKWRKLDYLSAAITCTWYRQPIESPWLPWHFDCFVRVYYQIRPSSMSENLQVWLSISFRIYVITWNTADHVITLCYLLPQPWVWQFYYTSAASHGVTLAELALLSAWMMSDKPVKKPTKTTRKAYKRLHNVVNLLDRLVTG